MAGDDAHTRLVLSVNAGSSSLKISVFKPVADFDASDDSAEPVELLLTASLENLTAPPALFTFKVESSEVSTDSRKDEKVDNVHDHESGFQHFLDFLHEHTRFDRKHIKKICHRVVHGGDYERPVLISNESYHHIEMLSDLAPLHNDRALAVIKACITILPDAESIAFFDSMFHATLPPHASRYAIDPVVAEQKGLRKYGFHGLSYSYILRAVSTHLHKPQAETTLIVMHLGSGASICAIRNGHSIDTSMGLTPLDGLPGATRSGSVDPSMIFHYTAEAGKISRQAAGEVHISEAEEILNKHSGWKALTGTTDFREISARAFPHAQDPSSAPTYTFPATSAAHPLHALAFNILADRILTYVGSYFLKLGGARAVDAVVFSGGIGERSVQLRSAVAGACACLGFGIDERANAGVDAVKGVVVDIGEGVGGLRTLVCRTDEQLEMARQCVLDDNFST